MMLIVGIEYTTAIDDVHPAMLRGFFDGWPNPPSTETHLRIFGGSSHVVLAIDKDERHVVGFINAVSDGFHCAFIPMLEVLPAYRKQGIGRELLRHMLAQLEGFYAIDLSCDSDMQSLYERFGFARGVCMMLRDHSRQASGAK